MSGLMKDYSKEISDQLTAIAVVLPGDPVKVGDIVSFREGRRLFGKAKPIGRFQKVSDLGLLDVETEVEDDASQESDTYIFASRKGAHYSFDATGGADGAGAGLSGTGKLTVQFSKAGAIYFAAIDCTTRRLRNLAGIEVDLNEHRAAMLWKDTFLVNSVTIASRALIMQSATSSGVLEASGDVAGLIPSASGNANAGISVSVGKVKDASFIKDWSENVTVLFGLSRFVKKDFGSVVKELDVGSREIAGEILNLDDDVYALEEVSPFELLDSSEE